MFLQWLENNDTRYDLFWNICEETCLLGLRHPSDEPKDH